MDRICPLTYNCIDRTVESIQTGPIRLTLKTVEPDEKMKCLAWLTTKAFLVVVRRQARDYLDAEEWALNELPPERFIFGTNTLLIT